MSDALQAFHFLRPWWLLALLPAWLLARACLRGNAASAGWARVIDPALLHALMLPQTARRSALPLGLLLAGWSLAVIGLAGPAWERLPEPVHRRGDALVVALDLSGSMLASDLSPSRLARARFKLSDLLAARRDAYTGLIAYAGDAHVVTPLSDDVGTVAAMLPALDPDIMPVPGNDPVAALRLALALLQGAGAQEGRVLLVTDGFDDTQARAMASVLEGSGVSLAVLGVGTREGGPVPLEGGGFARDASGGIAIPRLDVDGMRSAAGIAGASFREITIDDADLLTLLPERVLASTAARTEASRVYDQWRDRAPWVALCLLPLAALGMRRGWLLILPLCLCLPAPQAQALDWQDLWLRKDQQGAAALAAGDAAQAAQLFQDPAWKGSAQFQAGDWAGAVDSFAKTQGADGHYNRGNALARAGKLQDALAAYDAALASAPSMEDALANRKLIEDLLRQQQEDGGGSSSGSAGGGADESRQQANQGKDATSGQTPQEGQTGEPGSNTPGQDEASGNAPAPSAGKDPGRAGEAGSQPQSRAQDPANQSDNRAKQGSGEDTRRGAGDAGSEGARAEGGTLSAAGEGNAGEEDQAVEQWLRQVPDDPGALLRRKFEYEAARRAGGIEQ